MPDNLPPHAYGDAIADVYDELTNASAYGPGTQAAVDFLARCRRSRNSPVVGV
jgi:hypothetical protein